MPGRGKKTCPIEGCETEHSRDLLMCARHWWDVPKPLRDEVWRAIRATGPFSDEYMVARDAAIESVS